LDFLKNFNFDVPLVMGLQIVIALFNRSVKWELASAPLFLFGPRTSRSVARRA